MYFGFKDLKISYDQKEVIKDVTMDFEKGKITTIIGKNGCGKSSILRTLTKAVKVTNGCGYYLDKKITSYKKKELAKKIAILPQVHSVPPDIDVRTLVSYGRFPYSSYGSTLKETDWDIINSSMKATDISHLEYQKVSTLSGGERQRAWISMAICQQPEILILDEPITFLDLNHQIEILELIKNLNKKYGITIVMVLHDLNFAIRYSDYIFAIKDGYIYKEGMPKDIVNQKFLEEVFSLNVDMYYDEVNKCPYFIVRDIIINENKKEINNEN
ncbi:MAG: ABC transporter ATP-binding protein [Lachnospirales bacterium]